MPEVVLGMSWSLPDIWGIVNIQAACPLRATARDCCCPAGQHGSADPVS